ncbi:esterase-like activity of phytase family protein [Phyllobacterium meliloti]|uniref:esterase-like activity of phytase family protein n=1 Tax=Phyllobacterium meliloti TaxID=555317 RepID=UPI001D145075|nr:esterase-like activity of phytase family protein [Phyllobacterium sp. T1293]UGX85108.1 esterase-like activity of phytase family protein [Phyllobacterium sp. T1293]
MKTLFVSATVLLWAAFALPASAEDFGKLSLLGEVVLPTGLKIAGVEFGGISGLDYDVANDIYYAISDDRSEKAPARFYTLTIAMNEKGINGLDIVSTRTLLDAEGKPFATKDVDPESIRFNPATGTIYWTSEGDLTGKPAVRESRTDGTLVREFALPDAYLPNFFKTRGVRNNLSFESMTISPDGKTLLVGTENALVQDGEAATLDAGSRSRILAFDIASGNATAEYAYDIGPIFAKATQAPYWNDNGMSEFVAAGDDLLTVERAFAMGVGNQINFYRASFNGATNVNGEASLKDKQVSPLKKELLLKLGEGDFGLDIDNIESITWGPEINGRKTLVVASDNNFNPAQFTQFVVFQLAPSTN